MALRTPITAFLMLCATACAGHTEILQPELPLWPGRVQRFQPVGGGAEVAWVSLSEAEAVVRAVGEDGKSRPLVQPLGGQTVSIEPGETLEMTAPVAGPAMLVVFRALHDADVEFRSDELVGGEPRVPVSDLQGRVLVESGQTLRLHVSDPESLVQLTGPAIGEFEIEVVAGGGPSNRIDSSRGIVFRGATDVRIRHGAPNPRPLVFGLFDTGAWDLVIER